MNPNLQQIMQLGQQLQARMPKLQESLDAQKITASSGGGMVTATVDGKGQLKQVKIDPTCVDARDVEMLEDLVLAAVFMVYMAEPAQLQRTSLGVWVLCFLGILFVVSYALKKEYWKDVH